MSRYNIISKFVFFLNPFLPKVIPSFNETGGLLIFMLRVYYITVCLENS